MKNIKIKPFPNWKITAEAFENSVKDSLPAENIKKQKIDGKVMVALNQFNNGDKRVNFMIPEMKNGKTFMSVFPDPIQLYYSSALKAYITSEELRNKEFIKYAKKIIDEDEKYILNINSDETHPIYNSYLQFKITAIIMLNCSIEAFVNSMVTDSVKYTNRRGEDLDQQGIQRRISLKEKIEKVIPLVSNIDFKSSHKKEYDRIKSLIRIRNEFVHLKNYNKDPFSDEYQTLFVTLQKFNIKAVFEAVKIYMNEQKDGFIVDK